MWFTVSYSNSGLEEKEVSNGKRDFYFQCPCIRLDDVSLVKLTLLKSLQEKDHCRQYYEGEKALVAYWF